MGRGIDGHAVRVVAWVLVVNCHEARLPDVEDGEVTALSGHVEPPKAGIDAEHVWAVARLCGYDRMRVGKIDTRERRVALARDERTLAVRMDTKPMGGLAVSTLTQNWARLASKTTLPVALPSFTCARAPAPDAGMRDTAPSP